MALEFTTVQPTDQLLTRQCLALGSGLENGTVFTFIGYDYATIEDSNTNKAFLRFTTTAGIPFLASQLFKAKMLNNGSRVEPSGTFNQALKGLIVPQMTDADLIYAVLVLCYQKNTYIKIRRDDVIIIRYDGTKGPGSILHLDWDENNILSPEHRNAIENSIRTVAPKVLHKAQALQNFANQGTNLGQINGVGTGLL